MGQDAKSPGKSPCVNVPRSISDAIRDLQRAGAIIERAHYELCMIERAIRAQEPPARPQAPPELVVLAPAVQNFHLEPRPSGGAVATLDGKRVKLTPVLAAFIIILASDEGPSADDFVPFKSLDTVIERLGNQLGRHFSRYNVTNLLYRLRKALRDPRLIDRSAAKGLRLRLKRCSKDSVAE